MAWGSDNFFKKKKKKTEAEGKVRDSDNHSPKRLQGTF